MPTGIPTDREALAIVERIGPKFKPVWEKRPTDERIALARYFLPHYSKKEKL